MVEFENPVQVLSRNSHISDDDGTASPLAAAAAAAAAGATCGIPASVRANGGSVDVNASEESFAASEEVNASSGEMNAVCGEMNAALESNEAMLTSGSAVAAQADGVVVGVAPTETNDIDNNNNNNNLAEILSVIRSMKKHFFKPIHPIPCSTVDFIYKFLQASDYIFLITFSITISTFSRGCFFSLKLSIL
jgi:hypothetical protein